MDGVDAMNKLNCGSIPHSLASFCVVKQSWRCFALYLDRFGLTHLHTTVLTIDGFDQETRNKTARQHAQEAGLLLEYEQIVGHFFSRHGTPAAGTSANSDTEASNKK